MNLKQNFCRYVFSPDTLFLNKTCLHCKKKSCRTERFEQRLNIFQSQRFSTSAIAFIQTFSFVLGFSDLHSAL